MEFWMTWSIHILLVKQINGFFQWLQLLLRTSPKLKIRFLTDFPWKIKVCFDGKEHLRILLMSICSTLCLYFWNLTVRNLLIFFSSSFRSPGNLPWYRMEKSLTMRFACLTHALSLLGTLRRGWVIWWPILFPTQTTLSQWLLVVEVMAF